MAYTMCYDSTERGSYNDSAFAHQVLFQRMCLIAIPLPTEWLPSCMQGTGVKNTLVHQDGTS